MLHNAGEIENEWRDKDPQHAREQRKYAHPVPSREFLLSFLDQKAEPLTEQELATALDLADDPALLEGLNRRLEAMLRDGQLVCNRRSAYGLPERMNLVRGLVLAHRDGFGFLRPDDGGEDVFLPPRQMRALLHGDRALVRIVEVDRRNRRVGSLLTVLERNTQQIVGRFVQEGGTGFVEPDNRRFPQDVLVPPGNEGGARPGQIVVVDLVEFPSPRARAVGRVREVLGEKMAAGMEIDVAIRSHGIPHEWSDDAMTQAEAYGNRVAQSAKREREDLRGVPLVTIDGEDAKDFDDAVFCERTADGWRLLVAIADVAHYVRPADPLDEDAIERGTSVYFPGQVVPMLPEALSNGLCSLNPRVDRLCTVAALDIGRNGTIRRHGFFRGVIRSAARLTYHDVARAVVDRDAATRRRLQRVLPHLEDLYALFKALHQARERRGAIDFDTTETRIEFGEGRKIERIVPVERTDAHRLIEECMIAANVAAARFLAEHKIPTLYRVHAAPPSDDLSGVREFLKEFGLTLEGGDEPSSADYARLLRQLAGRDDRHLIQTVLLRSLSRASYTPDNHGHFGLGLDAYAHFTSPIRRYPDLLVHRGIHHVLQGGTAEDFPYRPGDMLRLGEECTQAEQRADEATRDVDDWLKCEFMQDRVGETFAGRITGVTGFGLFVELEGIFVTGLVHVSSLENDYYHFEAGAHRLLGERSGRSFRLGDRMHVRLVRVDLDDRKIDFEPAAEPAASPEPAAEPDRPRRRSRRSSKRKKG